MITSILVELKYFFNAIPQQCDKVRFHGLLLAYKETTFSCTQNRVLRICNAVHTLFLPEYIPVICLVSFDFLVKSVSAFDKYQREGFQYYSEQLLKLRL